MDLHRKRFTRPGGSTLPIARVHRISKVDSFLLSLLEVLNPSLNCFISRVFPLFPIFRFDHMISVWYRELTYSIFGTVSLRNEGTKL